MPSNNVLTEIENKILYVLNTSTDDNSDLSSVVRWIKMLCRMYSLEQEQDYKDFYYKYIIELLTKLYDFMDDDDDLVMFQGPLLFETLLLIQRIVETREIKFNPTQVKFELTEAQEAALRRLTNENSNR